MMNEYNYRWTREKFIEYRKLKISGYSHDMLKEYFGEDIYHSGLYNKNSNVLPYLQYLTEIIITPKYTDYKILKKESDIYSNKFDYIINFIDNDINYTISLFYYIIDDIDTYNILLTTSKQWDDYKLKLDNIRNKGYITDNERIELVNIVEKETGYNQLYPVIKKLSYILLNFIETKIGGVIISIGNTDNPVKINLYRNIIKNSFPNVIEIGNKIQNDIKYYLYKIE